MPTCKPGEPSPCFLPHLVLLLSGEIISSSQLPFHSEALKFGEKAGLGGSHYSRGGLCKTEVEKKPSRAPSSAGAAVGGSLGAGDLGMALTPRLLQGPIEKWYPPHLQHISVCPGSRERGRKPPRAPSLRVTWAPETEGLLFSSEGQTLVGTVRASVVLQRFSDSYICSH